MSDKILPKVWLGTPDQMVFAPQRIRAIMRLGSRMHTFEKHNIKIVGNGAKTMLLAHGYGCDQVMWRFFRLHFRTITESFSLTM